MVTSNTNSGRGTTELSKMYQHGFTDGYFGFHLYTPEMSDQDRQEYGAGYKEGLKDYDEAKHIGEGILPRKALLGIHGEKLNIEGYVRGESWHGWNVPYFSKEVLMQWAIDKGYTFTYMRYCDT